ncbi:hypothetical protein BIT28_16975 [Photobacterium proteolyticum]|uniref:Uncharacterized protein n=1 Tax=Photobacterium proteolyticum TaxID=1903952 RepID=A0A1Q9GZ02_9GAMM|nr:hypothetical protein BIT28_16975 [Photobacterium proteolyticum]
MIKKTPLFDKIKLPFRNKCERYVLFVSNLRRHEGIQGFRRGKWWFFTNKKKPNPKVELFVHSKQNINSEA